MSRIEAKFREKWAEISAKNYANQAIFFLNGFWEEGISSEAETIFLLWQKIIDQDADKKKEGNDLDEFEAHKFLESLGETLTVIALREKLRQIDLDNNNRMSFLEYLVFKYKKSVEAVVNSPQGDNTAELAEAQARLEEAQNALIELQQRLDEQKKALAEQKRAEQSAEKAKQEASSAEKALKAAEDEVRKTETAARAAEAEVKKALDELKKQEDDYNNKIADLTKKTQEGTLVQKNKAVQELAALKSEDPLPLRKAKITQESALRKAEKSRKEAEAATNAAAEKTAEAKAKRIEAERTLAAAQQARLEAEEAARQVEAATVDAERKFQEASDAFEEVKKKGGVAHGQIWWLEREIKEAKKYLPKSRQ